MLGLFMLNSLDRRGGLSSSRATTGDSSFGSDLFALVWETR